MVDAERKIRQILDELYNELSVGWRDFEIAKNIRVADENRSVKSAFGFFQGTYEACLDMACLSIAKIILKDERGKPANIWYLLNCLQNNPEVFTGIGKKLILDSVDVHRKQLEDLQDTINKIERQRQNIAHIDKWRITDRKRLYTNSRLNQNDLEIAYTLVLRILSVYKGYLRPSEDISHLFYLWSRMIQEDVEFMVRRTQK
jgi:hypothetical protein